MTIDDAIRKAQHDLGERLAARQWQMFEQMLVDGASEIECDAMLCQQRQLDAEWLRNYLIELRAQLLREYGEAANLDDLIIEPIRGE